MKREIVNHYEKLEPKEVPTLFDPAAWLAEQTGGATCWLLAYADDGVIWGKVENGQVLTSWDVVVGTKHESYCPPLREVTLQSARLFNENGEIMVWRDAQTGAWRGRMIYAVDEPSDFSHALDEQYLLWGNRAEAITDDFTLLRDSGQGLRHIVPLATDTVPALRVRHLIKRDDKGFARITASRLVALESHA